MDNNTEPQKYIYGRKTQLIVKSIRESSHREPEDDTKINWMTITRFSIRFSDGGWFKDQTKNQILNIHKGDKVEAWLCDNHYTYLKNMATGEILYDNPKINPAWVEYDNEKTRKAEQRRRRVWNQKSIWLRIKQEWKMLLFIFGAFIAISSAFNSIIPMLLAAIIYYFVLRDKR